MSEEAQAPQPLPDATITPAPQKRVALSLADLNNALKVIDISLSRGTFSSEEISLVSGLRTRIEFFLEASNGVNLPSPMNGMPPQKPTEGPMTLDGHEPQVHNRVDNPDANA